MKILFIITLLIFSHNIFASELLDTINTERTKRGLTKLVEKSQITCAATKHSKDIGSRRACSHTGSNGSNTGNRLSSCGYSSMAWGEIVACGQKTPKEAVNAWLKSSGHSNIMLSKTYKYFGGSMYNNYWTVVFTK